jgi:P-type Ca2+ transporter type 2C
VIQPTPVTDEPTAPTPHTAFHTLAVEQVAAAVATDPVNGLSAIEAARRLAENGANLLRETEATPKWKLLLRQFEDFMIWVLMGAALLAGLQGEWIDTAAIVLILVLNAVLGFAQEFRAEQALAALKELSAPTAHVVRDGIESSIHASELVVGDVVVLEAGDQIPADGRIQEAAALRIIESALTGESEPVHKSTVPVQDPSASLGDRVDMVFAGTAVAVGRGRVIITATGTATEVGKIADLLAEQDDEQTPLQAELQRVGKRIALIVLVIAALIFAEQLATVFMSTGDSFIEAINDPVFRVGFTGALLIAVSLAVAAIPEGLPAVVTIALSLGVRRMAEHHAIVRRLTAVETLGSTTFICSDKTGTLTRNEMTVRRAVIGFDRIAISPDWGIEPEDRVPHGDDMALLLQMAAANNDARPKPGGGFLGDPTETALLEAAGRLAPGHLRPRRVSEVPFDSERKRMTTIHELEDERIAFVKGGADVVLGLCTNALVRGEVIALDDSGRERLRALNEGLASSGFRTLAFATRNLSADEDAEDAGIERDLTYVGILGLVDPPREEVAAALAECKHAGIKVAMVTGDHALTARAIAIQIGLLDADAPATAVITGTELASMTDQELCARAEDVRVYARVNPEDKIRIVSALKEDGEIVAMTGDGVNDAPALKRADIGIAMGNIGTDVAREAADMVLADDNFATIVEAVGEGRTVFDNLQKVILFLLSCNMSEVLVVFSTAIFVAFFPEHGVLALLPLQLLWINLVTDGPPALALGVDPADPAVMDRYPRDSKMPILSGPRMAEVVWQGLVMTVAALGATYLAGPLLGSGDGAENTMLFTILVFSQKLHAFNYRSARGTVFSAESFKNRWLNIAFVATVALQVAVVTWPPMQSIFRTTALSAQEWVFVAAAAFTSLLLMDLVKLVIERRMDDRTPESSKAAQS